MDEWKEQVKEYVVYCKEDKKEDWINDINALNMEKFSDLPAAYEDQIKSFIKTAEIMKALDEGESWKQIGVRLMEGHKYCQYPIGIIGHMMLAYSKHGIEFVKIVIGHSLELITALKEEFDKEVEKENIEEKKLEYDIQDDEIILRLWEIKSAIKDKKQKDMSNDELILFLKSIMNYDDMQIWLMGKQIEGIELTLNDKLKKFFELKSNEDILNLYDVEQNYNQNNINGIRKVLENN